MDITEDQFMAYEGVRASGVTNMCDVSTVEDLSGLNRETILYIMQHYGILRERFLNTQREAQG